MINAEAFEGDGFPSACGLLSQLGGSASRECGWRGIFRRNGTYLGFPLRVFAALSNFSRCNHPRTLHREDQSFGSTRCASPLKKVMSMTYISECHRYILFSIPQTQARHPMSSANDPERTDADSPRLVSSEPLRLLRSYEVWTETMDAFAYWILLWTNGEDYFIYRYPSRWDLPTDDHKSSLIPLALKVPQSYYCPPIPLPSDSDNISLTPASFPLPDDTFVKRFEPIDWDPDKPGDTSMAETVLAEARVSQTIRIHGTHKNVCEYRGYIQKDGLITGLCYQRLEKTLEAAVEDGDPVDIQLVLDGLRCGLDHLHSIGIVHVCFIVDLSYIDSY